MKRTAKILRYISLAGLVLTIMAYWQHWLSPHQMGITVALLLCLSSISSLIRIRVNAAQTNKFVQTPSKQKTVTLFIYLFGIMAAIGLILSVLGMRYAGRMVINFAFIGLLCAFVVFLFIAPVRSGISAISPAYRELNRIFVTTVLMAPICVLAGFLLKMNHYSGTNILMYTGVGLMVASLLPVIVFVKILRGRYLQKYPLVAHSVVAHTASEFDRYVGTYTSAHLHTTVNIMNDETGTGLVIVQPGAMTVFPLKAIEQDTFTNDRLCIVLEFKPEENTFTLIQHERSFEFIKSDMQT